MPISDDLLREYKALSEPVTDTAAAWKRQRGYRFEKLLNGLLCADDLDPRTSYKAAGEQIDGSFFLDGTVILFEAKWHADEIPASTLYQFKGKVDGKLLGTLGVFISMSGYSADAVDALTLGKSLNLILFDQADIDAVALDGLGFREVLRRKLRAAAEQGLVYLPMKSTKTTMRKSTQATLETLEFEPATGELFSKRTPSHSNADLLILCESSTDCNLLTTLAQRVLEAEGKSSIIQTVAARGKQSIPRLANVLRASIAPAATIILVADSDGDVPGTLAMLQHKIDFFDWVAVIPDPEIESWLNLDPAQLRKSGPMSRLMQTLKAVESVDLDSLRGKDTSFNTFYNTISGV